MKFEEQFPSLQYERGYVVKNISENSHDILILITYSELSISKNCIDKQKVKEAFLDLLPDKPITENKIMNSELQEFGVNTSIKRTRVTYVTRESIIQKMTELGLDEDNLLGIKVKVDSNLKSGEWRLENDN